MKYIFGAVVINLLSLTTITFKINAFDESITAGLTTKKPTYIINNFNRYVVEYIGACPGVSNYGVGYDGDLRFISYSMKPNEKLKVRLTNVRTNKYQLDS